MPQVKPSQQYFGIHRALLYHANVRKFAEKRPGFRGKEEYLILIEVAADPYFFTHTHLCKKHFQSFGLIYARQPNDVLDFMRVVRKIISKWNETESGKVIVFCYEHQTAPVDDRRRVYDEKGKLIAVIVKNKFKEGENTIPVSKMTPEKANELSFPKRVAVSSLTDGELATILNIKTESVKKARQSIIRIDKEMALWEPPEVVHYMKTGEITPALKRLWAARRKGKN